MQQTNGPGICKWLIQFLCDLFIGAMFDREYLRRSMENRRRNANLLFEDETRGTEKTSLTDEAFPNNYNDDDIEDTSMFDAIPEHGTEG